MRPAEARFWSFVDTTGGLEACWPWLGTGDRYGMFSVNGTHVGAHRYSLERTLGRPLGPGMQALHTCDNPPCVNPAHLFEGTNQDNVDDKIAKGRDARGDRHGRRTRPERTARGSRVGGSKLTEVDVVRIRERLTAGASQRAVAREFGVDRRSIQFIAAGRTWQHVA